MSMNKLMDGVEKLVNQEYELSSKDHGEQFYSYHEAYAVIKEEIEETQKELGDLYKHFSFFWNGVKHDAIPADEIKHIARSAHLAACELIQVTAMAYKATLGLKGDNSDSTHGDLIDRDDLLAYFERKSKGKTAEETLKLLYTALKAYPTVIEKEN